MWWPMPDAIRAATEGRFLLQGGPLALLLAQQAIAL
jgi:ADP-ribose pyrophosphatase